MSDGRTSRGRVVRGARRPGRSIRQGALIALGLASCVAGAGCNTVLGIDEAELCSGSACETPDFVQDRTQANMPAPSRGRDAGVGDAGSGIGDPGLVVPLPNGGGGGGTSTPPSDGADTDDGTEEAPGSNASLPDDVDNSGTDNSGNGSSG